MIKCCSGGNRLPNGGNQLPLFFSFYDSCDGRGAETMLCSRYPLTGTCFAAACADVFLQQRLLE
jgi:hypothetical protein